MNIANKVKGGITSAFVTGSTVLFGGLTAYAEGDNDLDAVTNSVTSSIQDIINVATPIAWAVVILVIIVIGFILLWGGDKAKEKVKSHIVAIVIGCVLIAGAATIASWWTGSLTNNFGTQKV